MADSLRPTTLLLATVCAWALAVLILASTGTGGRFAPAAAGTGKPPAIPHAVLVKSKARLGALTNYVEVGARPLLTADRRPEPVAMAGAAGSSELDVTLTSVLITSTLKLAILTGKDGTSYRVKVGESVRGSNWTLAQLEPRHAVLQGPMGQRNLELRVFDGRGGVAPTPMVADTESDPEAQVDRAEPANIRPQPIPQVQPANPVANNSAPTPTPATQPNIAQEQQIEAIRRRIEARRAQMRAAAAANSDGADNH